MAMTVPQRTIPQTITGHILDILADGPKTRAAIMASVVLATGTTEKTVSVALSTLKARGKISNPEPALWQLGPASPLGLDQFLAQRPLHLVIGEVEDGRYRAYSPTMPGVDALDTDPFATVNRLLERIEMALEAAVEGKATKG